LRFIPIGATLCATCKTYQRKRHRWTVNTFAVGAVLLTVLGLALGAVSDIWRWLRWKDDVVVTRFSSWGQTVFTNHGSGRAFVTEIELAGHLEGQSKSYLRIYPIGQAVEPGQSITHDNPLTVWAWQTWAVRTIDHVRSEELRHDHAVKFFDAGNPRVAMFKTAMPEVLTIPATATVRYSTACPRGN